MFRDIIYEAGGHPLFGLGVPLDFDWKDLVEARQRIEKIIINKIEEEVYKKIEKFLEGKSKIVRTSTELFGYNENKPTLNSLVRKIETFLNEIVTLGVINRFRINLLEGEIPMIILDIYQDEGHRRYSYAFNINRIIW